jgi:hypothetical protein
MPAACLLVGFAIGAFVFPGMYSYGTEKGMTFRVNRITGVEQYASSKGWVSQQEAINEVMTSAFGGFRSGIETMAKGDSSRAP